MSKEIESKKVDPMLAVIEECRANADACLIAGPDPDESGEFDAAIEDFVDQYKGALDDLALLEVDIFKVDQSDLEALADRKNADLLAELIDSDPAYRVLRQRHTVLEFETTQLDANSRSPGIPAGHYKRLVYLVQAGLSQLVDPTLVPNGHFGPQTRDALEDFQLKRGIENIDGTFVDERTLDALVCELRFDLGEIRDNLGRAQRPLIDGTRDEFYINGIDEDGSDVVWRNSVRQALADAMLWVGALDEGVDVSTQNGRKALQDSIEEYLGKEVDIIGKRTIGEILSKIDLENPVVEKVR